ncbi:unnamed protein product [Paramecium sonneborni]|uniref:Uncharacterized protein n=1 Tax=Paramecium sonneborni TaxID=65129 RepID=A0A8S1QS33_9CILI|nr:unnamed protein product [Paramecium sonneborni]
MGNNCISKQDTFEEAEQQQITTLENEIQSINTSIQANNSQLKQNKESLEEGVQISNIQLIMIEPRNAEEGAQIVRNLLKFGNQIVIIPKTIEESPNVSTKSLSKKGILKNKGSYMTKLSLQPCKQQKIDKYLRFEKK